MGDVPALDEPGEELAGHEHANCWVVEARVSDRAEDIGQDPKLFHLPEFTGADVRSQAFDLEGLDLDHEVDAGLVDALGELRRVSTQATGELLARVDDADPDDFEQATEETEDRRVQNECPKRFQGRRTCHGTKVPLIPERPATAESTSSGRAGEI